MFSMSVVVLFTITLLVRDAMFATANSCSTEAGYCQHASSCTDAPVGQDPTCVCTGVYAGAACDYTARTCTDSPCLHGGQCQASTCMPANTGPSQSYECFQCTCAAGWGGSPFYTSGTWNVGGVCDYPRPVHDCSEGSKCFNGGTCTSINTPTLSTFSCACTSEFVGGTGMNCTVPLFNCDPSAPFAVECQNGGTCTGIRQPCSCSGAYGGVDCSFLWCNVNTCYNGATCVNTFNGGGFCACHPSYAGPNCAVAKPCIANPNQCANGGTCINQPNDPFFQCLCANGWSGPTCAVPTYCSTHTCLNGGQCVDTQTPAGAGTCQCAKGWTGPDCSTALTGCAVNGCAHGGICPCTRGPNCVDKCQCPRAQGNPSSPLTYGGCLCEITVPDLCSPAQGAPNPCENGGTCQEWAGGAGCFCRPGFFGSLCQFYSNPCNPAGDGSVNPCQHAGRCTLFVDNAASLPFTDNAWPVLCNCKYPYYGQYCEHTYNPLATSTQVCAGSQCQNGGVCTPQVYPMTGSSTSVVNGITLFTPTYICLCSTGYGGVNCEIPLDICSSTSNPCLHGGQCTASPSALRGVACACACGYAGQRCEIVAPNAGSGNVPDFCPAGNTVCANGGTCVNLKQRQSFACLCPVGWGGLRCQLATNTAPAPNPPAGLSSTAGGMNTGGAASTGGHAPGSTGGPEPLTASSTASHNDGGGDDSGLSAGAAASISVVATAFVFGIGGFIYYRRRSATSGSRNNNMKADAAASSGSSNSAVAVPLSDSHYTSLN